jgi:uncharacterized protein YbjT (DUF2867 family)
MILVVGATGFLGGKICQRLARAGRATRALVRKSADPARVAALRDAGVEIVSGDLKVTESLEAAVVGVQTVISTATATVSRGPGDSIETVDLRGQLHLIDAAKRAGIEHFVYVSFYPQPLEFPLQTAKRIVERAIVDSGVAYTIAQPVDFMEVWLGPALGFDPAHGRARILGDGTRPFSWVSIEDVAALVERSVGNAAARNKVFALGGAPLSYLEVLEIFTGLGVPKIDVEKVPESALLEQLDKAQDPLERSIAALMLGTARGQIVSGDEARTTLGITAKTVAAYAAEVLARG